MSTEQKPNPASVNMDARNFLRAINTSAQSKVSFFEHVVERLGQEAKRNFKLTALHPTAIFFEDTDARLFYTGDIKKDGPRWTVTNIKHVNVVEEKKADLFDKNCNELVDAIAESDFKAADKVFNRIEMQRFRSRVIPESGLVRTKDGETRYIPIQKDVVEENKIPAMIQAITNVVADGVEISEGHIVSGTFSETGEQFTIPVDDYTRRKIVARKMRMAAESAHKSPTFQKLVANIAALVSENKIPDAVSVAAKFLREQQEFCLLGQAGMKSLVESALASQMEFNPILAGDVATLMYRTNLKANRDTILDCWSKTAQKAQSAELLTSAQGLSESKDFEKDYNVFLESLFNESGVDATKAKAYSNTLKILTSVLKHVEGQESLVQDAEQMVQALSTGEPATDVLYQVEELLAGVSDGLVDRVQTLDSFDRMPGIEDEAEMAQEEPAGEPVPLPDMGAEEPGMEDPMAAPAPEMAAAPAPAGAADLNVAPIGAAESKNKKEPVVSEGNFTPIEKMSATELEEELQAWQTQGHVFLKEDGFEDCFNQLNRYIDRCSQLSSPLLEQFEQIRDVVIDEGSDVSRDLPEDPYAGKVSLKEGAKINQDYLGEDIGGLSGPEKGPAHGGDKSGMSELQTGKGVADKGLKKVDGTDSTGTPGADGAEEHEGGLAMSKDFQSKSKGIAEKGLKKVDGTDAANTPNAGGAEEHEGGLAMSKDFQSKTKPMQDKKPKLQESLQERIAAALGEGYDKQTGAEHKDGGGTMEEPKGEFGRSYKEGEAEMGDEFQGDKFFGKAKKGDIKEDYAKQTGVEKSGLTDGYLKQPKGEFGRKYKDGETDMADENQDKTEFIDDKEAKEPVKESERTVADAIADAMDTDDATSEDQRKGPRQHPWGRKKAALAPREVKEGKDKNGKAVKEEVAVYTKETPLDEVIQAVLDSMKDDMAAGMGMEPGMDAGLDAGMEPGVDAGMGGEMGTDGVEPPLTDEPPMGGDMPPMGGEMGGEMGGGEEMPGAPDLETPEAEAGKEFDAENLANGIPPEGAPGHDEMESPEEKAAEAEAGAEAKPEKKGPPPPPKKEGGEKAEKKGPPKKDDDKDDKKKEESRTRGRAMTESMCKKCGKAPCKCCGDCGKVKCECK